MKFFDAFSGYGGFHLGIERAFNAIGNTSISPDRRGQGDPEAIDQPWQGLHTIPAKGCLPAPDGNDELPDSGAEHGQPHCVGWSEVDKYAIGVYRKHFGGENYGDIRKIEPTTIPDFDLFVGGFPCQAFSVAGKRLGFNDTRGTLFYEIARIIKVKRPPYLLLENVKGLLSHDNGRTFETILRTLSELGYSLEWQVLNSKDFGVPQNRERVFIVGYLGGFGRRKVFPIGADAELHSENNQERQAPQIACPLRASASGKSDSQYIKATQRLSDAMRIRETDGNSVTLKGLGGGLGAKTGLYQTSPMRVRRLTPIECERLMGLPDGWTAEDETGQAISDSQRYKLCCNGVVVNVVEKIIRRLYEQQTS